VCVYTHAFMNEVRKKGSLIRVLCVFFSLCCEKKERKKRKKKFWCPIDVRVFFGKKKSREESFCRFVFLPSSWVFILGHEFNSNTCRLLRRTARLQKRYFKRRDCGTQKERARTLFEFFFFCLTVCNGSRADNFYARAFTRTRARKERRDAR